MQIDHLTAFADSGTSASATTKVYGPASSGRVRDASRAVSVYFAITDTCDFDKRSLNALVLPEVTHPDSLGATHTG